MDLEIEMNMGEANFKELGKEQVEMEMDKEMKKEENKAMEEKENKKIEKMINIEMGEKKKKNKKKAMDTEMVTKTNPEKRPGIGKLMFTTSMMEKMLEMEKKRQRTNQEKNGEGQSFSPYLGFLMFTRVFQLVLLCQQILLFCCCIQQSLQNAHSVKLCF